MKNDVRDDEKIHIKTFKNRNVQLNADTEKPRSRSNNETTYTHIHSLLSRCFDRTCVGFVSLTETILAHAQPSTHRLHSGDVNFETGDGDGRENPVGTVVVVVKGEHSVGGHSSRGFATFQSIITDWNWLFLNAQEWHLNHHQQQQRIKPVSVGYGCDIFAIWSALFLKTVAQNDKNSHTIQRTRCAIFHWVLRPKVRRLCARRLRYRQKIATHTTRDLVHYYWVAGRIGHWNITSSFLFL